MSGDKREKVRRFLDSPEGPGGRAFAWLVQILIVTSLIEFAIETEPNLPPGAWAVLHAVETFTVIVFTIEYALRLWSAEKPLRFALSPLGIVDLLAIVPFYLALGVDLRSLRALRLFRLVRLLKIARYNDAMRRIHQAFRLAREELALFFGATLILLYLSAVGIYYFERGEQPEAFFSVFSSLWWAVVTLTTVGYGDVYPVTTGGRVFTFFILMIGLGIVALPSGILASALSKVRDEDPTPPST